MKHGRSILLFGLFCAVAAAVASLGLLHPSESEALQPVTIPLARLELRDERLHRRGRAEPFTGAVIERYANGRLKSKSEITRGRLNGLSEGWHTNGVRQIRETFSNGMSHGRRLKWYSSGVIESESQLAAGRLHGAFRRWNTDGSLAEEMAMRDGRPDGVSLSFHRNGSIKVRAQFAQGELVTREQWELPNSQQ